MANDAQISGSPIQITEPPIQVTGSTPIQSSQNINAIVTIETESIQESLKEDLGKLEKLAKDSKISDYLRKQASDLLATIKDALSKNIPEQQLEKLKNQSSNVLSSISNNAKSVLQNFSIFGGTVKDLTKLLGSAAPLAMVNGIQMAFDKANKVMNGLFQGLLNIESENLKVSRTFAQTGITMGNSFADSSTSVSHFKKELISVMGAFQASQDEINNVNSAFKGLVDLGSQFKDIGKGTEIGKDLGGELNLTSAAFLTASATGSDLGTVAKNLATDFTELGSSELDAVKNLGLIRIAQENSKLGFDIVHNSIIESAKGLKMWGGTVSSVSSLFKSFSDSLTKSGVGRQGLTPELFQRYISGIQQMNIATRAFMGMQMPGMASKGAIGAGLEMEKAMETGEGMKQISENLIATLKQYGGGQVITREQAIASPELQNSFMVQRQLLGQMLNVDQATANQMMGVLQDIDANGMASMDLSDEKLKNLLDSGKDIRDSTISTQEQLAQMQTNAILSSGEKITSAIKDLSAKFPVVREFTNKISSGFEFARKGAIKGSVDASDIERIQREFKGKKSGKKQPFAPIIREQQFEKQESFDFSQIESPEEFRFNVESPIVAPKQKKSMRPEIPLESVIVKKPREFPVVTETRSVLPMQQTTRPLEIAPQIPKKIQEQINTNAERLKLTGKVANMFSETRITPKNNITLREEINNVEIKKSGAIPIEQPRTNTPMKTEETRRSVNREGRTVGMLPIEQSSVVTLALESVQAPGKSIKKEKQQKDLDVTVITRIANIKAEGTRGIIEFELQPIVKSLLG